MISVILFQPFHDDMSFQKRDPLFQQKNHGMDMYEKKNIQNTLKGWFGATVSNDSTVFEQ